MFPAYVARNLGGGARYFSRCSNTVSINPYNNEIRKHLLLNLRINSVPTFPFFRTCCCSCTTDTVVSNTKNKIFLVKHDGSSPRNYSNFSSRRYLSSNQTTSNDVQPKKSLFSSDSEIEKQKEPTLDSKTIKLRAELNEWKTVYRFKYIKLARVIQKAKVYQTAFTCCIALPGSIGFYLYDAISFDKVGFMVGTSMLASVMLYIMGRFCSRLIGVIYVSKMDNDLVRIARLNFWGQRTDEIIPKTDFVPFSELPDDVSELYVNLRFYSDPDHLLHICLRYGLVFDNNEFEEIFGTQTGFSIVEKKESNK